MDTTKATEMIEMYNNKIAELTEKMQEAYKKFNKAYLDWMPGPEDNPEIFFNTKEWKTYFRLKRVVAEVKAYQSYWLMVKYSSK